jgi:hypothetical protein
LSTTVDSAINAEACCYGCRYFFVAEVADVALALVELFGFGWVDVKADDFVAGLTVAEAQRQAYIAEAYYSDDGGFVF